VDFYDIKADVEALFAPRRPEFAKTGHPALHPGRCAAVLFDGEQVGVVGELHPRWVQKYELGSAPVVFELELAALLATPFPGYVEVSRFPAVTRDLALVVPMSQALAPLISALRAAAPAIVRDVALFDVYQGKGLGESEKSLAFRIVMQDTQRTLEDAEVEAAVAVLVAAAGLAFGASLRG
jgi:phenylalanyl-tRNA synthetase beta chain